MRHRLGLSIIAAVVTAVLTGGCSRNDLPLSGGGESHVRQSDVEERVMKVYANDLTLALQMIDSAKASSRQGGQRLTEEQADLLRAKVYSRTFDSPRYDSAIVISERLLATKSAKDDPTFRQDILELLVYSTRQLEDYELQLAYSTQLADAYSKQGNGVEALRTEAEVGAVLYRLGKADEGLAKMDSVISLLNPVRRFNELDASIIAMKRKIGIIRDYNQIALEAQQMLSRIEDYERHPADFKDSSPREPADEARPGYIAFYRAQAWAYLAAAYAHLGESQKAREYLALVGQSDFGQTLAGKKMMAPTLCLLGEYRKMETIYEELETVFMERGDTLTLDYAQLLLDRAKAAEGQGRMAESIALWEKHAQTLQKAEERLLSSKATLYAARHHAQEQQMAISRQQAELSRRNIVNIALAIGLAALLAGMLYVLRQQRILRRKNGVLAHEISEAIAYRDKYEAMMYSRQAADAAAQEPHSLAMPTDEQLFQHIARGVIRDELFLDPALDRQKLTHTFQLTKEQVGSAFSKGSPYKSVTEFINECRLLYAAKMLAEHPDIPIGDVAEASGFARAATFSANFKKKYALTPAQYRERLQLA